MSLCCALGWAPAAFGAPGDHIVTGAATITPEVTAGVEGRSNAYLADPTDNPARGHDSPIIPAWDFYLSPALGIDVKGKKIRWTLDGRYEMRKFFEKDVAPRLDQFSDFHVDTRLEVLPEGVFGFGLHEEAKLRNRPTDEEVSANSLNTQFRNDLGLDLKFRPGPELDIVPGGGWSYHDYRIPGVTGQVPFDNRNTYEARLGLAWRFFPNTALVVDASYAFNRWDQHWIPTGDAGTAADPDTGQAGAVGEYLALPDSDFLKASTGIRGRLGRNVLLVLTAGWGFGKYDVASVVDEANANGGVATEADGAAVGFDANVTPVEGILVSARVSSNFGFDDKQKFGQKLTFEYRKDFEDSFFTNYVAENHLKLFLESRFGQYVNTRFEGSVRFESYAGEVTRRDIFAKVDGALNLTPTRYLTFQVGGYWARRQSSDPGVEYDNVQGRFLATFAY